MSSFLELDGVDTGYGGMGVLHGLSLTVQHGELAVLLGANGVGKTTTLRAITGQIPLWGGAVRFDGQDLRGLPPERIVRLGIGVIPEPPGVFRDMTVHDNLRVGGFALGSDRATVERRCAQLLEQFPLLDERRDQLGGSLSGGEQRTLAVSRALMGSPRLLLVDEVSTGLSPQNVAMVFRLMRRLCDDGITVCMVEQNVSALGVADRAFVMEKGRVAHEASGAALERTRDEVARAYLGGGKEVVT